MAVRSGYFNSRGGDRKYNAEDMSQYFRGLITHGVLQNFGGKFMVVENGGMSVKVKTGRAYFSDGKWMENTAEINLELEPGAVNVNRIDRIVLRKDNTNSVRDCSIIIKKGTAALEPVAPTLQNDEYVQELSLCQIKIKARVESISQADITDERPNTELCGFVHGVIQQIDTTEAFAQYDKSFKDWFNDIKDAVGTVTLIRQYTSYYITSQENEIEIPIQIPQYKPTIDIINVYVNGLQLVPDVEYTKTQENITLNLPLPKGQIINFEIYKCVDGSDAETVVQQVYELQQINNSYLSDSGWQPLELSEGITEYDEDNSPVRYRKIGKQVFIEGLISGLDAANAIVATIPEGYRPDKKQLSVAAIGPNGIATLIVTPNGEIEINSADTPLVSDYISLKTSYLID